MLEKKYPPIGEIIDVDNKSTHIRIIEGEDPTILFFSDIDMYGSLNWDPVQNSLGDSVKTISYDRYGYYWSEEGTQPRDAIAISKEIESILGTKEEKGPYIIVCHAMGAIYGRVFAGRNLEDVYGIIFIDPVHPEQLNGMRELGINKKLPQKEQRFVIKLISKLGLSDSDSLEQYYVSDDLYRIAKGYYSKNSLAWFDEKIETENSLLQAKEYTSFGEKPLVILTSKSTYSGYENLLALWLELQSDLLNLSSNSKQVILENVGHYAHIEEPQVVVAEVMNMIDTYKVYKGTD